MFDLLSFLDSLTFSAAFALFDDEGDIAYLALALLASGFIYYGFIYARYRNQDKRHSHEHETRALIENVQVVDQLRQHRTGLSNAEMAGRNDARIEGALNRGATGEGMLDVARSFGVPIPKD
ncbi:MAG: hypothetical protein LBI64_03125 [Coriobacteriales bacterium]|nr:hypothetical protein [Coriobacteriales bacterium]